jgi:uncharacterized protein
MTRSIRYASLFVAIVLAAGCVAAPATPTASPTAKTRPQTPAPSATSAGEASPAGEWKGQIEVEGQRIPTEVTLSTTGGLLKGTISFPTQNVRDLPLDKVSYEAGRLHLEVMPAPRTAVFDGQHSGNTIAGQFAQSGYTGKFALARVSAADAEPPTYRSEEVTFSNAEATLAGTLTVPEGQGRFPAVVLISGSGVEDRDEDIFGFRIFGVLADHLSRHGIAVLRYDDRGAGGSTAASPQDTSETYAGDVAAAVEYLKGRPEIDPQQIGLLGHSEGGIIAPMVAAGSDDVALVIMMAGTGVPGSEVLLEQSRLSLVASGLPEAEIAPRVDLQERTIAAAVTGDGWDTVKTELVELFKAGAESLPAAQRRELGNLDRWAEQQVQTQMDAMMSPWMQFFLKHDPAPVLAEVDVPVLAIFGGKDTQVSAEQNRSAVIAALEKGGNTDVTTEVFPDANHLFQSAQTGGSQEYGTLKPEFVPGFLETITSWIQERTKD